MLQTGASSHRAGFGNMPETIPPAHRGRPGYENHLTQRVTTLAERLRGAGYRTFFTGKWHLGHTPDSLPTARGYDHALALSQSGADNFENKPNLLLYDRADWTEDGRPAALPTRFYSSRLIVDRTLGYLATGDPAKPFFVSINFLANHIPVQAADADLARYRGRYDAGWTALREARRAGAVARGVMPPGVGMVTMQSTPDWASLTPAERRQRAGAMEAYALGLGEPLAMSAEHGEGIADLFGGLCADRAGANEQHQTEHQTGHQTGYRGIAPAFAAPEKPLTQLQGQPLPWSHDRHARTIAFDAERGGGAGIRPDGTTAGTGCRNHHPARRRAVDAQARP
jgi:arylsulfatase/uncharacterized sulfatase